MRSGTRRAFLKLAANENFLPLEEAERKRNGRRRCGNMYVYACIHSLRAMLRRRNTHSRQQTLTPTHTHANTHSRQHTLTST